jgi:UDP-N-acetylglucosamine acyltransferase
MAGGIHPTAIIDPSAAIGADVEISPYVVIEGDVVIGDRCRIGSHALIAAGTRLGAGCRIFNGASVGTIPQDLKFEGEYSTLTIGDNTIIREFCTINRGTKAAGATVIGKNCAFLAYCHVAHDCIIGDNVVVSNNLAMGGHVVVGNNVGIGGLVIIHQFCRIGDCAFIAGGVRILKDVVPFAMCGGDPGDPRIFGINTIGLERHGFDTDRRMKLKRIFRVLFRQELTVSDALDELPLTFPDDEDVKKIIAFIKTTQRGIIRMPEGPTAPGE